MPVTDAERLRAAGRTVTLAGGEYPLIFDFGALLILEQDIGDLSAMQAALDAWSDKDKGINLHHLRSFLAAGLAHVPLTADEVVRGILLSELPSYISAVTGAVMEAFVPSNGDGQGNSTGEEAAPSNGTSSTSSPQSATADLITTSGG